MDIKSKDLIALLGCTQAKADQFLVHIQEAMGKAQIGTPIRAAHFFAQVGHECLGLHYMEEIASGESYEGREDLGNDQPGDGVKYKGHGIMQVTGKFNHLAYGQWLGLGDLFVRDPQLIVTNTRYAALTAGFFYATRPQLNLLADKDTGRTTTVSIRDKNTGRMKPVTVNAILALTTQIVNGGYNGIEDRQARLIRNKKTLAL